METVSHAMCGFSRRQVTFVSVCSPVFVTTTVQVMFVPTETGLGGRVEITSSSARAQMHDSADKIDKNAVSAEAILAVLRLTGRLGTRIDMLIDGRTPRDSASGNDRRTRIVLVQHRARHACATPFSPGLRTDSSGRLRGKPR